MKCLILAAGYATRLYPLTENFPKPLLEVRGKAIIDWLLEDIESAGAAGRAVDADRAVFASRAVDGYVVISNHKYARHFEDWAAASPYDVSVVDDGTTTNEGRLGAVRDIWFAVERLGIQGDILVVAGDNLLDFSLASFIHYAQGKGASCVMRYYEKNVERLKRCGVAQVDGDDLIVDMVEKPAAPASHWATPPFYYLTGGDAHAIPSAIADGCGVDAPGSYIEWLCKRSPVYAMEMPGSRYDIGNLESYEKIKAEYKGIIRSKASYDSK
ncbi:MAG: nucleotidyltransferase family protein [Oscillospiraceae bacterium]|nr:nucleotidyltransferase family protein [Oscillospiraceae bacterium]